MSEAPKKIWVDVTPYEFYQTWSAEKSENIDTDVQYIRADLVDELVGALAGVLPFTLVGGSDVAWAAIDRAIKALEKMKEET